MAWLDLVDIGMDVIHPIQKHTMDERTIARAYHYFRAKTPTVQSSQRELEEGLFW